MHTPLEGPQSRRRFLSALPAILGLAAGRDAFVLQARAGLVAHPNPRPGIDASRVLPSSALGNHSEIVEAFEMVRRIPQVVDGIMCYCGCAELPESYSLLSCFEADGMARSCSICRDAARLVFELHAKNRSLAEIRRAIDAEFG